MEIYKLPKKRWTKDDRKYKFYWSEKDESGKWTKKFSPAYATKVEAMNAERDFLNEKETFSGDMNMTFGELTDQYVAYQKNRVRRRTLETYLKRRRYFTKFENLKLRELDGEVYHQFQQDMWSKDLKSSSRNDVQKFLKAILNWGMRRYDINLMSFYNKIEFFSDPNEIEVEKDFYTPEEFNIFISASPDLNTKVMFELLYYCGLRRGEARGLQWTDINWNEHTLSITKQANSVKDHQHDYELTPPKTKKSIRTLPIVDLLYNDLQELYTEKKKYYGFNNKWFVFGTYEPLTFYKMQALGWDLSKKADIRHLPLHGFRHSCASLLINLGQDAITVSKYLGHASIKETLDTYAHMFPNNLVNAKSAIDKLNNTIIN